MVTRVIVSVLLTVLMVGTTATCQEAERPLKPVVYAVKVLAPNGGETWTVNTAQTVLWELNSAVAPDSIRIRLTWKVPKEGQNAVKGNRLLATIRGEGEKTGKWEWDKAGPVGDGMKIQVEAFFPGKKKASDVSDEYFAIVAQDIPVEFTPPTVKITSPNGGEIWKVGSKHLIKWTAQPAPQKSVSDADVARKFARVSEVVKISLSRDGGTTWQVAADRLELETSEWEWTIPDIVGDKCRLRVALLDQKSSEICKDDSDADFRIIASDTGVHPDETPQH
jgi:hypothetical protein